MDIILVGFLEISYHISSMAVKAMEAYEGGHLFHIPLSEFEHITKKDGMCVIEVFFSQDQCWFHGSKV